MGKKEVIIRGMPGPPLPDVISELVDRLVADDWCRFSTEDGTRHYYEIGFEASAAGRSGNAEFPILECPAPKPLSPFAEWYSRSQVASAHPDYVQRARRDLETLGVPPAAIDGFIQGEFDFAARRWYESASREQRVEALRCFLQALKISEYDGSVPRMDLGEQDELEVGRQKMYLREICSKYRKILSRGAGLDPVSFHDPQLEEACRCYLYGFYRASIVLSAAAVEVSLKRCLGKEVDSYCKYGELVNDAEAAGKLIGHIAESAREISCSRNRVAHSMSEPENDKALLVLGLAKEVVNYLLPAQ
jgi:HEPN domain-containing protein